MCRFDDGEEACRNAIEIWEEAFGVASPMTATSLELLANIMRDTGRFGRLVANISCPLIGRNDTHRGSHKGKQRCSAKACLTCRILQSVHILQLRISKHSKAILSC